MVTKKPHWGRKGEGWRCGQGRSNALGKRSVVHECGRCSSNTSLRCAEKRKKLKLAPHLSHCLGASRQTSVGKSKLRRPCSFFSASFTASCSSS